MTTADPQQDSALRAHVRRELSAHLSGLGYTKPRPSSRDADNTPEIVQRNPVRGRIAYGETVLPGDLERSHCHERLLSFSQRRTRRRSTILFFIGVVESQQQELEELLDKLGIRIYSTGGGHVHVIPIAPPPGLNGD